MQERFPNIRTCFAHGGQLAQMNLGRRIQGFDGRPDLFEGKTHPRKAVGHKNIFFDTLVHDTDSLKLMIDKQGASQVIMGLDDPYPLRGDGERRAILVSRENFRLGKRREALLIRSSTTKFGKTIL